MLTLHLLLCPGLSLRSCSAVGRTFVWYGELTIGGHGMCCCSLLAVVVNLNYFGTLRMPDPLSRPSLARTYLPMLPEVAEESVSSADRRVEEAEEDLPLVDFGVVAGGKARFDVCRLFLASLQLVSVALLLRVPRSRVEPTCCGVFRSMFCFLLLHLAV